MTTITAYCYKCDSEKEVESIYIGKEGYLNIRLICKHSVCYVTQKEPVYGNETI